jgi:hypothetical protein
MKYRCGPWSCRAQALDWMRAAARLPTSKEISKPFGTGREMAGHDAGTQHILGFDAITQVRAPWEEQFSPVMRARYCGVRSDLDFPVRLTAEGEVVGFQVVEVVGS